MDELTAEQVRKAIFNNSIYASYDGAKYYADGINMQAIADELNAQAYTTDEVTLSGMFVSGLPIEDVRVFGMTLDEVRQMMKRDAEHERTCHAELNEQRNAVICSECGSPELLKGWGEYKSWEGSTCIASFTTYNHCPNCGAKVIGGSDE